jgi:hypothetical protein
LVAPYLVDHTVVVRGKGYLVTVYRESEDVWIADGNYMDRRIQVKASCPAEAEQRWVSTVTKRD